MHKVFFLVFGAVPCMPTVLGRDYSFPCTSLSVRTQRTNLRQAKG